MLPLLLLLLLHGRLGQEYSKSDLHLQSTYIHGEPFSICLFFLCCIVFGFILCELQLIRAELQNALRCVMCNVRFPFCVCSVRFVCVCFCKVSLQFSSLTFNYDPQMISV